MNEKSDFDIIFNKLNVLKNKEDSYRFIDYLCNLKLFSAPLDPKFGVASHFISSCDSEMNSRNK